MDDKKEKEELKLSAEVIDALNKPELKFDSNDEKEEKIPEGYVRVYNPMPSWFIFFQEMYHIKADVSELDDSDDED